MTAEVYCTKGKCFEAGSVEAMMESVFDKKSLSKSIQRELLEAQI